jgi:hypothetical protein
MGTPRRRLTGLGEMNYRNIGLSFAIGVLVEMRKEIDPRSKQATDISRAEEILATIMKGLPDGMTEEQVALASAVFYDMEVSILKWDQSEYRGFMTDQDREELFEMVYPIENCGTDYI